jgi:hypothetical protein
MIRRSILPIAAAFVLTSCVHDKPAVPVTSAPSTTSTSSTTVAPTTTLYHPLESIVVVAQKQAIGGCQLFPQLVSIPVDTSLTIQSQDATGFVAVATPDRAAAEVTTASVESGNEVTVTPSLGDVNHDIYIGCVTPDVPDISVATGSLISEAICNTASSDANGLAARIRFTEPSVANVPANSTIEGSTPITVALQHKC